jgi:flagellar motor switch protein FliN
MSESSVIEPQEPARLIQLWAEVLGQALGDISGSPLPCTILTESPANLPPAAETDLWILVTSSGALRGEMMLRLPATSTVRLAQIFMSEPATAADITSEHREATLELLRQVGGLAATAIKSNWGEVQLHLDIAATAPSWPASSTFWFRIGEDTLLEILLSAALAASLRTEKTEKTDAGQPATAAAASSPTAPSASAAPSPSGNGNVNLDLLMDVELAVMLRFGSRCLPLREVLDLNPGSVIELDRRVQEPVDMLLDGRIVARGEVVVVEGNYGLRVTEVAPAGS